MAGIGKGEAAGVAQHMRVGLQFEARAGGGALDRQVIDGEIEKDDT